MARTKQSELVEFLPTPPPEARDLVLKERRRSSRALAEALAEIIKLRQIAYSDPLTGLPNRLAFNAELPNLINVAKKEQAPLALFLLDVDGLKRTNDNEGHPKGDQLLSKVAEVLRNLFRHDESDESRKYPTDIFGRLGGDEFFVILPLYQPNEGESQESLDRRMQQRIESNFKTAITGLNIPKELNVGISIGIATLDPDDDFDSLYKRADEQLNVQKLTKKQNQTTDYVDDRL